MKPTRVKTTNATAQIETAVPLRGDGELATAMPQADAASSTSIDELTPAYALIELDPSDLPRYAARPLARLWSLVMLSCGLRPTVENEEMAYQRGGSPDYRARLRTMRGRVLDRRFHPVDEPLPGYLLNFYLVDGAVAADDSVDDQFVRTSDFLAIAEQEGWGVERSFFERPLNGLATPALLMEMEETPQRKLPGEAKWNAAHHKILLGLLKQLSVIDEQFRDFFDGLVASSKAELHAHVRAEVNKLLKSKMGREVLNRWCTAMDEAIDVDGTDLKTVEDHLRKLAHYFHDERKNPQKKAKRAANVSRLNGPFMLND